MLDVCDLIKELRKKVSKKDISLHVLYSILLVDCLEIEGRGRK
jgi:hypothetical protein